jgi:hypothetical protein
LFQFGEKNLWGKNPFELIFLVGIFEISHHYTYTDTSLLLRVPRISLLHTYQHISLCWGCSETVIPHEKKHSDWMNRKVEIQRLSFKFDQGHSVQGMCFSCGIVICEHHQQRAMCSRPWNRDFRSILNKISVALSPSRKDACVYIWMGAKSRKFRAKNISSNDFFLAEIFFSKFKQLLRTCSPIAKTHFQTILHIEKKFFKDGLLFA